jgi:hypothetical protein
MSTFLELKNKVRADAFCAGEAENLMAAHDGFFQGALADLCQSVDCLKNGHVNIFPSCATYFQCGLTVIPAPRGSILSVYTIGKSNRDTTPAKEEWCSKAFYEQVDYCQIERFVKINQRVASGGNTVIGTIFNGIFGCRRRKTSYPAPTDVGMESLPPLPPGFHYPQAATDAGFRARGGVYAIYRGRIYVAPWIESDESLVIEWNGIKAIWSDADGVDDDIKFQQAVLAYVSWQHYLFYEENPQKRDAFEGQYRMLVRELIHECREHNRKRECDELGGAGAAARGMGSADAVTGEPKPSPSSLFWNEFLSGTLNCQSGYTGTPVAWTVRAGTVSSTKSVADANAIATSQAQSDAQTRLVCTPTSSGGDQGGSSGYYNSAQTYTASCPGASGSTPAAEGNSVTVTIPASQFFSAISKDLADQAAHDAAVSQATAQLVCTFWNSPQTDTVSCPDDPTTTNSATVGAHQFSFTNPIGAINPVANQEQADQLAKTQANANALAGLTCVGAFKICNTIQKVRRIGTIAGSLGARCPYDIQTQVAAGTICRMTTTAKKTADQLSLNQEALAIANQLADAKYLQLKTDCDLKQAGLNPTAS